MVAIASRRPTSLVALVKEEVDEGLCGSAVGLAWLVLVELRWLAGNRVGQGGGGTVGWMNGKDEELGEGGGGKRWRGIDCTRISCRMKQLKMELTVASAENVLAYSYLFANLRELVLRQVLNVVCRGGTMKVDNELKLES